MILALGHRAITLTCCNCNARRAERHSLELSQG
jgi:hypothetical protein